MEAERMMDETEGESEERRALRLLLGGKMLRRRGLRRLQLGWLRADSKPFREFGNGLLLGK